MDIQARMASRLRNEARQRPRKGGNLSKLQKVLWLGHFFSVSDRAKLYKDRTVC